MAIDEDFQAGARHGNVVIVQWLWEFGLAVTLQKAKSSVLIGSSSYQDGRECALKQFVARHNPTADKLTLDRP